MAGPDKPKYSLQAEQAKISAIGGFKQKIAEGIVENWYQIHPSDGLEPTSENVTREMEAWINPPTDANGNKPKYVNKFGMSVPTEETMEEYGNAAARAVDKGTDSGSFWNKIVTFFQALFAAIGDLINGKGWTFTENYARITSENISQSFEGEMKGLAATPEHRQFIEQNNLVELGKQKIDQAVKVEAGLAKADPVFDLDKIERPNAPPPPPKAEDFTRAAATGTTPQEKIAGVMTAVIGATKAPFEKILAAQPKENKDKLAVFETKLKENAQALAAASTSGEQFSDILIKKTCRDCGIDLGAGADKLPMETVLGNMRNGTDEQVKYSLLLSGLDANVKAAYPQLKAASMGRELTTDEQKMQLAEQQRAQTEGNKKQLKQLEEKVTRTVAAETKKGIVETVAKGIMENDGTWYNPLSWGPTAASISRNGIDNAAELILSAKDKPPTTQSEKDKVDASVKTMLDYVAKNNVGPSPEQVDKISEITGKAVSDALRDPSTAGDKAKLARAVQHSIEDRLTDEKANISALGVPINDLNNSSGKDLFHEIAMKVADSIRENQRGTNGRGTYDELAATQATVIKLQTDIAQGAAKQISSAEFNAQRDGLINDIASIPGVGPVAGFVPGAVSTETASAQKLQAKIGPTTGR